MVPVFSPKANARKICCIQLLKDWRIWMEESRSQRPKGDLSFQLLGIICLPAMRESSKSRMIWESAENHLGNPKGHPKVAENPRKLSAAQLEKRQPNGLKVCSIWWARRASSLPRRRNHKKECLAAYQSFHFPQLWTSTNLSLHHSCLLKLRAVWFYRNNHLQVANPILWGKSVFIASGVWFWDPDFGWISLATHHHLQVCALLVVGFVDVAWLGWWGFRIGRMIWIMVGGNLAGQELIVVFFHGALSS